MRTAFLSSLVPVVLLACFLSLSGQQTSGSVQAVSALQAAVQAMAGAVPLDSVATGSVQVIAGSENDQGTLQILTRGTAQTSEQAHTASGSRAIVYSQGLASETDNGTLQVLPMELASSSECPDFPLPYLAGALNNPDTGYRYIGPEDLNGHSVYHVRFWNTFNSNPGMQALADFTARDIWIDAASSLPVRLSYERRAAGGSGPRIAVDVYYSNYQNVSGVLYPFLIQKSYNGTPWQTITVQSVAFDTGLTDANFPTQ